MPEVTAPSARCRGRGATRARTPPVGEPAPTCQRTALGDSMRDDPQPAATRPATPAGEPAPATPAPASEHAPATVSPTAPAAGSATTTLAAGDDVASALLSRVL